MGKLLRECPRKTAQAAFEAESDATKRNTVPK